MNKLPAERDGESECYLCGRCTDACPVDGALRYRRHADEPQH